MVQEVGDPGSRRRSSRGCDPSTTFDRIASVPGILGGRACIRGMRIPVSVILGQVAHGATTDEAIADYPDLEPEDIRQALRYAAWLASGQVLVG